MKLEAVWFKDGKEVHKVSPVINVVCDEGMESIDEIEIKDENGNWVYCGKDSFEADDFEIRVRWK